MTRHRQPEGLPSVISFDVADYLQTEEDIACYVKVVLEDSTALEIATMIGDVTRASERQMQTDETSGDIGP